MAYFAIGLPIAILIRLFAGVPLFWFIVIPITILTFIGIAKMDTDSMLYSRKFKDGKSIDSLAMAKKYCEEYHRMDEKYKYKHFCEQQKYFWKKGIFIMNIKEVLALKPDTKVKDKEFNDIL